MAEGCEEVFKGRSQLNTHVKISHKEMWDLGRKMIKVEYDNLPHFSKNYPKRDQNEDSVENEDSIGEDGADGNSDETSEAVANVETEIVNFSYKVL